MAIQLRNCLLAEVAGIISNFLHKDVYTGQLVNSLSVIILNSKVIFCTLNKKISLNLYIQFSNKVVRYVSEQQGLISVKLCGGVATKGDRYR